MPESAAPQLVVLSGPQRGATIVLSHPFPLVFGRKSGMALEDPSLDDVHCQVFQANGRWFVQDFGSREGTWVGDERIEGVRPLELGRAFRIGTTHVGLVAGDPPQVEPGSARFRAGAATEILRVEIPFASQSDVASDELPVAVPERAQPLAPHAAMGEYDLLEPLGAGEVGQVWKAYDKKRRRVVAVKVLAPSHARDPQVVARFLRGAKAGGKLHHPHLVSILAAGHAAGHVYLTMEYVEGLDLERSCAARGGRIAPREAVAIMARIADALVYAHSRGVVHRNVTPGNILVGPGGVPKLADLTLAKRLTDPNPMEITRSDDVLVRSVYAPMEAIFDVQRVDARTDVYGCGATLFRAVTGRPPYRDTSPADLVQGRHADPEKLAPHLSQELVVLLRKCLRPDPSERYHTASQLLDALAELPEAAVV